MSDAVVNQLKGLLKQLTPSEKAEVVAWLGNALKEELPQLPLSTRQSARGLWADLGVAPSAEEIDEARHEMWGNFPREDV